MNNYSVNVYGENCVKIIAERLDTNDGTLKFFRGDELVASFLKWQYWTFDGKKLEDFFDGRPCPNRIDRGFRKKS